MSMHIKQINGVARCPKCGAALNEDVEHACGETYEQIAAELAKFQEVAARENTLLDSWIAKAGEEQRRADQTERERNEALNELKMMKVVHYPALLQQSELKDSLMAEMKAQLDAARQSRARLVRLFRTWKKYAEGRTRTVDWLSQRKDELERETERLLRCTAGARWPGSRILYEMAFQEGASAEIERLRQQVTALRKALNGITYESHHDYDCAMRDEFGAKCTCGYEEVYNKAVDAIAATASAGETQPS